MVLPKMKTIYARCTRCESRRHRSGQCRAPMCEQCGKPVNEDEQIDSGDFIFCGATCFEEYFGEDGLKI